MDEQLKYFIAAEKVANLIMCIEMLLEFVEEFKIEADEHVKKELSLRISSLNKWIKDQATTPSTI